MTNISLTTLPIMDADRKYDNTNYTFPDDSINYWNVSENIYTVVIGISIWVSCILGAVGNGIVIWLLGFRIKRNPFSTFILNLAVADLGVLLSAPFIVANFWVRFHYELHIMFPVFYFLFLSMYSSSQFLLTAISVDRCEAVFFPVWHRCHRPPHLSTIVCALIWFLSFLLTAITYILFLHFHITNIGDSCQFIVNAVLCLPVMTIATVALFIKVCLKARQHRRGKLLTIVLLTLLFFLLFAFPLNVIAIFFPFDSLNTVMLLPCLNSSVNPAIYILVGRKGKSRQRKNMKMILEKIFKEEESCTEETPVETQS